MALIFVNRFFYPDESATSLMLGDLVFGLGEEFGDRYVIAGRSGYRGNARLGRRETVAGVEVHRVPALGGGNASIAARLANFASFYLFGFFALIRIARRGDVVVCLTDPPLGSVALLTAARLRRAVFVNWLQDIYPETANRLGYGAETGVVSRLLRALRDRSWRRAEANVVLGERMRGFLDTRGIAPPRIRVIGNWADEQALAPVAPAENPLRRQWGIGPEECVAGYSGNLGRAHDVATMLDAMRIIARQPARGLRFLFVGDGAKLKDVRRFSAETPEVTIDFRPFQQRGSLRESLAVPDIHWLSLDPRLEGLIVPSKFYGAAAAGRPIVFVGSRDGEIARLVAEGECGRAFACGEAGELARYLLELASDPPLRQRLGAKARAFALEILAREKRFEDWRRLLREVAER